MKIVIVGPANPFRGGIAKFNEVLAENLIASGHTVEIINFTIQYPGFLFPGSTQFTDAPTPQGFKITRIVNSINPLTWAKAVRYIRTQSPDLVILRYWMPFMAPSLGYIARRLKRKAIRTVALTDNIIPHEKHFYDHPCTKYFLSGINKVVYMSKQVGLELEQFNFTGEKAFAPHPIYNSYGQGVTRSEACAELGLDTTFRYVMFFGFIREYKGLDLLLQAWAQLKNKSDKKLLIAGEFYSNREKYIDLINELNLQDEVLLHDKYIPENKILYYFSAADIVVQPYKTATQSGITQVAYNFGTPMIVTNVGGLAEIVPNDRVGYVTDVDPAAIAQAIEKYYNLNKENEFKANILTEKERFSWGNMIKALL